MLLTTDQLRERLGISREVAYRLMRCKSFPSMRLGRRFYVDEDKLKVWIEKSAYKDVIL